MNFIKKSWNSLFKKQQNPTQSQSKQQQSSKNEPTNKQQQEQQIPDEVVNQLFTLASQLVKTSKNITNDAVKLKIYAFYKQAIQGDCNTQKPQMFDLMGRTKWNAWNQLKGMSNKNAKMQYVRVVSQADPQLANKITQKLTGQQPQPQNQHQQSKPKQPIGFQKVQPTIYTYTHPYFHSIQKGQQIQNISHDQLLIKNNQPAIYPLHYAIDKQQVQLVKQFLVLLSIEEIESMQDVEGTGILEYAELIQNQEILGLVRKKLGK